MSTWDNHRPLAARLIITGKLALQSPTAFGSGDSDGLLDMLLLRDPVDNRPLLPGTSVAGALRDYLRQRKNGYRANLKKDATEALFGGSKGDNEGEQSLLIVEDAWAESVPAPIIRDGVRIDPQTRTAQNKKKFDYELLPTGIVFPLRLELTIPADQEEQDLLRLLALALEGFTRSEIRLGLRKRRGFGQCKVDKWEITRYAVNTPKGILAWLASRLTAPVAEVSTGEPASLPTAPHDDQRNHVILEATFELASPLLIRSTEPLDSLATQPDVIHIRSNGQPVIPGTSLAGVLRARAQRILNTLGLNETILNELFGHDMDKRPTRHTASRLLFAEATLTCISDYLVQQRVSIDRFTGGSYTTALFSEAPLPYGIVTIRLDLQFKTNTSSETSKADIGLLLLLLKDLWLGDLTIGGTSSIGRGRLAGKHATLKSTLPDCLREWEFAQVNGRLQVEGDRQWLEDCVAALNNLSTQSEPTQEQPA